MELIRWSRTAMCLVFIMFTIGYTSSRKLSGFIKKRSILEDIHVDLLPSGAMRVMDNRTSTKNTSTCLSNEYGSSCTFCVPHNTCVDGHYTCNKTTGAKICRSGWFGGHCNQRQEVTNYHVTCPESHCRNGGSCVSQSCCCNEGFTGVLCEIEIIECTNTSCANGGICKDEIGSFSCLCKPHFTGERCETHMTTSLQTTTSRDSHCQSDTCKNGGRCFEDAYYTYCVCPTGYTGDVCETRLLSNTSVLRNCPDHHYGERCDVICLPQNNCHGGHFICDPYTGSKICLEGWIGKNCDNRILPQQIDPMCPEVVGCKNDGQCFESQCCCKHNYTGSICNIESIGCLSNPCVNNATCYPSGNSYVCNCGVGYTGKQCETVIAPSSTFLWTSTLIESSMLSLDATRSQVTSSLYTPTNSSSFSYPILSNSTLMTSPSSFDSIEVLFSSSSNTHSQYNTVSSLETSYNSEYTLFHPSIFPSVDLFSSSTASAYSTPSIKSSLVMNHLEHSVSSSLIISTQSKQDHINISSTKSGSSSYITPSVSLLSTPVSTFSEQLTTSPLLPSSSPSSSSSSSSSSTTSSLTSSSSSLEIKPSLSVQYSSTSTSNINTNEPVSVLNTASIHNLSPSQSLFESSELTLTPVSATIDTNTNNVIETSSKLTQYSTKMSNSSFSTSRIVFYSSSIATTKMSILPSSTSSISHHSSLMHVVSTKTDLPTSYPTTAYISPTTSTRSSNTINGGKPDDTQSNGNDTSSDSSKSLAWWIILLIVAGVLAVLAVMITVIVLGVQKRRSDSRNLEKKPEMIDAYDKEHFSAQPDFQNHSFDIQDGDSDDDNIKHDMYIVNE